MFELVSLRFTNPRADIIKHIDRMATIAEQLEAMKASMDESLKVCILVASIDVDEMRPVIAAIMSLTDDDVKCYNATERPIEEWREVRKSGKANQ